MHQVHIVLSPYKAALFDMDGTMINNAAYHKRAWQEFLKRHNITLTDKEFKQKVSGKRNDQILALVFGRKLDTEDLYKYAEEKESIYREIYRLHIREIAGLKKTVAELQEHGLKIAIATTAPAKNREFALESLGLFGQFEVIIGDEHVKHGKPHPEIYLATAKELGVSPSECLVFEDSPPGVAAGKSAGMNVVALLSSHSAKELHKADYVVDDFKHIIFS